MTRRRPRVRSLLLVAVGGFLGAAARYLVGTVLPSGFPWGTLAVNVAGSFALGAVLADGRLAARLGPRTRLFLATGVLSSFTTYSTFAVETAALSPRWAAVNVLANYGLGFLAVLAASALLGGEP